MKTFIQIAVLFLIFSFGFSLFASLLGWVAGKTIMTSLNGNNISCIEEPLEGYHKTTDRKASLYIGFDCKEFEFKGQRVLEEQKRLQSI